MYSAFACFVQHHFNFVYHETNTWVSRYILDTNIFVITLTKLYRMSLTHPSTVIVSTKMVYGQSSLFWCLHWCCDNAKLVESGSQD